MGPADAARCGLKGIGGNAELDGFGAFGAGERPQRVAIGIDDLARARRLAWHDQLIAGGEDRNFWPAADGEKRIVHAGREREIAVGKRLLPDLSRTSPSRKSTPARRICRPRTAASVMSMLSPSTIVSS